MLLLIVRVCWCCHMHSAIPSLWRDRQLLGDLQHFSCWYFIAKLAQPAIKSWWQRWDVSWDYWCYKIRKVIPGWWWQMYEWENQYSSQLEGRPEKLHRLDLVAAPEGCARERTQSSSQSLGVERETQWHGLCVVDLKRCFLLECGWVVFVYLNCRKCKPSFPNFEQFKPFFWYLVIKLQIFFQFKSGKLKETFSIF